MVSEEEFETYKIIVNWLLGLVIMKDLVTREEALHTIGFLVEQNNFDVEKLSLKDLKDYL
jgi:hypothetical protein